MTAHDERHLLTVPIDTVQDVFSLRRSGQEAAEALRMERRDQVRLATALSELGRDRLGATGLTATFGLREEGEPTLVVTFQWASGTAPAPEALELATRLVHRVRHTADASHGRLVVEQPVPEGAAAADHLRALRAAFRRTAPATMADELRSQTRDLIATLEETRAQREELRRLNEELEETNRGVMALYTELSQELETTNSGVVALHTELEDKSRRLREASAAKTRFWTHVSHELRTPVNSVVGLTRLLLEPGPDGLAEEQHRQLSMIASSGQTLLSLVNDLLDVAKAESGQLEVRRDTVDLHALIGELGGALTGTPRASHVVMKLPDLRGFPSVVTDEVLLTRILRNLLSNSLKFTEKGEVGLTVDEVEEPDGPWLAFTVTDSGIGIPEAEQQRVFEEFYQVRGRHQRGRPGSGLGLPYARTLTELLGGSLVLTSAPGRGTRVDVRLPHTVADPGPEPCRTTLLAAVRPAPGTPAAHRPDDGREHSP